MNLKTVNLFGLDLIQDTGFTALLLALKNFDPRQSDKLPLLITPNVDQVVKFNRPENHTLFQDCRKAAFILPDGQPLVWASKCKYGSSGLQKRLTGSDLFPLLWNQMKSAEERVFMILPNEELGIRFQKEYPTTRFYVPPFFQVEDRKTYELVLQTCLERLRDSPADHVLIGLGFPKQEKLSLDIISSSLKSNMPMFYLLGASFEFYFGTKHRAPLWMQKYGLEFVHRMFTEPGRMIKRYLWEDLAFIPLLFKELLKR